MIIFDLHKIKKLKCLYNKDENGREINIHQIEDCIFTGKNNYYPNNLIFSKKEEKLINPINEKIMSLSKLDTDNRFDFVVEEKENIEICPLFYFIYNTDNYYHFIYDTLPYLISFFELKKEIKDLKLLMNYPRKTISKFHPFVSEFLNLIGVNKEDIMLLNDKHCYKNVYVSTSYTHGHNSNLPPRNEVKVFYEKIKSLVPNNPDLPKKIYISRRSWLHNDFSNMGTNYTTRRKMVNEDLLVDILKNYGFTEIFTEKLNTIEKIQLFKNAEDIVGSIGGGLCNVVFSNSNCKLYTIVSPTFLDVNGRFVHSLNFVNNKLFYETEHIDKSYFKLHMRVKYSNIVGEVINKDGEFLEIMFDEDPVSGWSIDDDYKKIKAHTSECQKLDNGLNSEYVIDLDKFKNFLI